MLKYSNSIFSNYFGGSEKISSHEFEALRKYIYKLCGLNITKGKEYLIIHRLAEIFKANGCKTWAEFHEKLVRDRKGALAEEVISAISTNETSFFRDSHPFESVRAKVFPQFLEKQRSARTRSSGKVRIWCAASSTGQEPYSLAMLISEYANSSEGRGLDLSRVEIIATDISNKALEAARKGIYSTMDYSRGLPSNYRKYFKRKGSDWEVDPKIRAMVNFRKLNLVDSFSHLGDFDFVLCRNVLIYFDSETRLGIVNRIADMLGEDSYLLLGASEGIIGQTDHFVAEYVGPAILYRKDSGEALKTRKISSGFNRRSVGKSATA